LFLAALSLCMCSIIACAVGGGVRCGVEGGRSKWAVATRAPKYTVQLRPVLGQEVLAALCGCVCVLMSGPTRLCMRTRTGMQAGGWARPRGRGRKPHASCRIVTRTRATGATHTHTHTHTHAHTTRIDPLTNSYTSTTHASHFASSSGLINEWFLQETGTVQPTC
jgi:hypothetical protein